MLTSEHGWGGAVKWSSIVRRGRHKPHFHRWGLEALTCVRMRAVVAVHLMQSIGDCVSRNRSRKKSNQLEEELDGDAVDRHAVACL